MPEPLPRRAPQTQKDLENEIADTLARGVATGELVPREMVAKKPEPAPRPATPQVTQLSESNGYGARVPGNIDLHNRPDVANADGSHSSVLSASFNIDGKEVLLPLVAPEGRIWTEDEAVDNYRRTGQNLGIFDSPDAATAAAKRIHEDQAAMMGLNRQRPAVGAASPVTPRTRIDAGTYGMPTMATPSDDPREKPSPWATLAPDVKPKEQAPGAARPPATPWEALASKQAPVSKSSGEEIGPPPKAQGRNNWMMGIALAADMLLNKGSNVGSLLGEMSQPDDTANENYQRAMKHRKDEADIYATRARADRPFGADPETLELRRQQIELRKQALGNQTSRETRLLEKQQMLMDPASPLAQQVRGYMKAKGVDTASLEGLSVDAMRQASPALKHEIDHAFADQIGDDKAEQAGKVAAATEGSKIRVAGGISDATQANKIALVQEQLKGREADREANWSIKNAERGEDFAKWYSTQAEKDIGIARLMDDIDAAGGAVPESLGERFNNWITQRGISADRIKPWQAKQMVMELWARQQTGAAISASEDDKFKIQTGLNPLASEEQVNAAYGVLGDVVQTWLRSKAAARPGDARQVLRAAGANDTRWLGDEKQDAPLPSAHRPKAKAKPGVAQAQGDEGGRLPKTVGTRNGKPVRAIKALTGGRGRVVFYADGSKEVVQ